MGNFIRHLMMWSLELATILLNLRGLEVLLARTAHVSFKYSLWGLVYFYISPGMPLNTGISGDISFINNWTFIHFHLSFVVIECFGDISTRYDNYVAHQHIHHLHGEQMNLIKDTWHTRHTPRVYPTYVIPPLPRETYPLVYSKQFNPKKFWEKFYANYLTSPYTLLYIIEENPTYTL